MTRIMIVEDNHRACCALKALVSQQAGMKVVAEASNGQEAIQKTNEHIPDVVIMDMRMPIMDGLEATKVIKLKWPRVKIVILTMYPDYQVDVLKAGADAFLLKGCPVEEMMSTIRGLQRKNLGNVLPTFNYFLRNIPPQIMYSPHA